MDKPKLLDLFCGAGGASMGYFRAGFEVVGVDIYHQPNYPFEFYRTDAMTFPLDDFNFIHASPPCQKFSFSSRYKSKQGYVPDVDYPDLVTETRKRLLYSNAVYVIENVAGAPIKHDIMLCGEYFDLCLHRHRYFETNLELENPIHKKHKLKGALHNCDTRAGHARLVAGHFKDFPGACLAMGIDWMKTHHELAEAIPPAYTEYIGRQIMRMIHD